MPVSEYIKNAEEVVSLVTFHKSEREMGRSNEQSQLPAATIAKPSRAAGALGDTAGHQKIQREVTKGGRVAICDRKPPSHSDGRVLAGSYSRENEMIQH